MKIVLIVLLVTCVTGCGWVANPRSKLATEAKKQTEILERIATSLDVIGEGLHDRCD